MNKGIYFVDTPAIYASKETFPMNNLSEKKSRFYL